MAFYFIEQLIYANKLIFTFRSISFRNTMSIMSCKDSSNFSRNPLLQTCRGKRPFQPYVFSIWTSNTAFYREMCLVCTCMRFTFKTCLKIKLSQMWYGEMLSIFLPKINFYVPSKRNTEVADSTIVDILS